MIDLVAELEALRPLAEEGKLVHRTYAVLRPERCFCPLATIAIKNGFLTEDRVMEAVYGDGDNVTMLDDDLAKGFHLSIYAIRDMCQEYDDTVDDTAEVNEDGTSFDYVEGLNALIEFVKEVAS